MSAIHDLPPDTEAGLEFNYALWTPNTQITLCNVPWMNDYRDVVRFSNQGALDDYLMNNSGPTITFSDGVYGKPEQPVRISTPFNAVYGYNYLRVHNPAQPIFGDMPRTFYYFILDVRYITPNNTEITVQLDVFQTFIYDVSFGNCYIERGHIGIANENNFDNYGRDYLTEPEGLDIGGEYVISRRTSLKLADARTNDIPYDILLVSTVSLQSDPGTVDDPKLVAARGNIVTGLPQGAEMYIVAGEHFHRIGAALAQIPWVSQGIISATVIPAKETFNMDTSSVEINGVPAEKVAGRAIETQQTTMLVNWRTALENNIPARYRHLKKFLTYPYCVVELTTYSGTPIIIKPESWMDDDATVVYDAQITPPSQRLVFYPYHYNGQSGDVTDIYGIVNDGGEFLDTATMIADFPQLSITNNGYLSYMASNRNALNYQHSSADWSQQRTMRGAELAFDQATTGIDTANRMTNLGVNAANQQTNLANETAGYNALQSGINSVGQGLVGGALAGGGAGAALGAAGGVANTAMGYGIQVNQNTKSNAINNSLARGQNLAQTDAARFNRDTNKMYANYATTGDYQNAIAGINAKVQDAKLTQPTTSGQIGGDAFNLARYQWGIDAKFKLPQEGAITRMGEYWLRYGYSVNRFSVIPSDLRCMTLFTYWKLRETYITAGRMPETFKQAIRGIFEKGVTVWASPFDIGNADPGNNNPLTGITIGY